MNRKTTQLSFIDGMILMMAGGKYFNKEKKCIKFNFSSNGVFLNLL